MGAFRVVGAGSGWSGWRLQVAALGAVAGLVAGAALLWSGASAVFSSTTVNPTSSLSTGTWAVVSQVLKWFGDGQYGQGGVADFTAELSPGQESTAVTTWTAVTAGGNHGCGIRTGNTLWCWGNNLNGQLGVGSLTQQASPTQVAGTMWATVSAGTTHTCATKTDGTLWCWGFNGSGQLGIGSTLQRTSPTQVGVLTTWATVSASGFHTCATKTGGGALWCWGNNLSGQIGIGHQISPQLNPVQVGVLTTWATVSVGANHTCATHTGGGTLFCWGNNTFGQIGIGSVGSPQTTPAQVGVLSTWASVSAGTSHTCARKGTDSTLWCWGLNTNGRLGDGTTTQRSSPTQVGGQTYWASVTAGGSHTCATRNNGGSVWCWGLNADGQLGDGTVTQRTSPNPVGVLATWAIVSAGTNHTCATKTDGTLWCWGLGTRGQLGNGAPHDTSTAIQVGIATNWISAAGGGDYSCGVRSDNTLWCWGANGNGQLGLGDTTTQYLPTQVPGTTWSTVAASFGHTCATRTDGTLWCWGRNSSGQVGIGSVVSPQTSPVQVGIGITTAASVTAGSQHTCVTGADGTLWCWGLNISGQVGNGGVVSPQTSPVQISVGVTTWASVAGGSTHTCATRTDNSLWCWGYNAFGQLGLGDSTQRTSPTQLPGVTVTGVYAGSNANHTFITV